MKLHLYSSVNLYSFYFYCIKLSFFGYAAASLHCLAILLVFPEEVAMPVLLFSAECVVREGSARWPCCPWS